MDEENVADLIKKAYQFKRIYDFLVILMLCLMFFSIGNLIAQNVSYPLLNVISGTMFLLTAIVAGALLYFDRKKRELRQEIFLKALQKQVDEDNEE